MNVAEREIQRRVRVADRDSLLAEIAAVDARIQMLNDKRAEMVAEVERLQAEIEAVQS